MQRNRSKYISDFLDFLSESESCYAYCLEELENQNKITQDYLHSLELDNLKYSERSKIATKLATNRKDRRYYKDQIEELEAVIQFLDDPVNKKCMNKLKQVLGQVRKAESYHKNRTYRPKVVKEEEDKRV